MADSSRPPDIKYTDSHEWVRIEGEFAIVGISDFAVEHLSDLTFLSLPETGDAMERGESFGEIESVKAVADLNAPVTGEVVEVNTDLIDNLDLLTRSPYEEGWMIKVRMSDPGEVESLLDLERYESLVQKEEEEG
ncbi:MAG: glycine cleavage system protein GcvH [Planctomycetota bacterium]|jgi:glycine cleavage system H protein